VPNRLILAVLGGGGLLMLIAGCGRGEPEAQPAAPAYGRVTVLDNPENAAFGDSAVKPLVRLDGVRGSDWLNGRLLLVSKENPDEAPTELEGAEFRPLNLYARDLSTGEETPLAPGADNQGYAVASPDRSRIFYKTFDWQSSVGTGYVMDLRTRRSVQVTQRDELELTSGVWLDDRTIVYAALDGRLVFVSEDGAKRDTWSDPDVSQAGDLKAVHGKIFYAASNGVLYTYDTETKKKKIASKSAAPVWASPSPDGTKLAVVQRIRSGAMELSVADADGRNRKAIAQDAQIFGPAWSPEGDRLAYAGIESSGMTRGIYVTNLVTGTTATLPIDAGFIADAPRWSPSGDRLMVTASITGGGRNKPEFVTYLAAAK